MADPKHLKTLLALLEQPENKVCADCTTRNPRWASVNIGCFVCIRCSGIHRNIGVHITKVRSVTLDRWTDEFVQTMVSKGNAAVNAYYEANLPKGFTKYAEDVPSSKVEKFIRDKYELQKYKPVSRPVHVDDDTPYPLATPQHAGAPAVPALAKFSNDLLGDLMFAPSAPQPVSQPPSATLDFFGGSVAPAASSNGFGTFQSAPAPTTPAFHSAPAPTTPAVSTGFVDFAGFETSSAAPAATSNNSSSATSTKSDILSLFGSTGSQDYRAALNGVPGQGNGGMMGGFPPIGANSTNSGFGGAPGFGGSNMNSGFAFGGNNVNPGFGASPGFSGNNTMNPGFGGNNNMNAGFGGNMNAGFGGNTNMNPGFGNNMNSGFGGSAPAFGGNMNSGFGGGASGFGGNNSGYSNAPGFGVNNTGFASGPAFGGDNSGFGSGGSAGGFSAPAATQPTSTAPKADPFAGLF